MEKKATQTAKNQPVQKPVPVNGKQQLTTFNQKLNIALNYNPKAEKKGQ